MTPHTSAGPALAGTSPAGLALFAWHRHASWGALAKCLHDASVRGSRGRIE
jgi:hypothetical protein